MQSPYKTTPTSKRHRLTTVALAVHLACAGLIFATWQTEALAQAQASASYNIPSGSLIDALNEYAQQAGVALAIETGKLKELRTKGLQGSYGIEEGFNTLLKGSGYRIAKTAAGYMLSPAKENGHSEAEASILPAVNVNARNDGSTEGTGSYTTGTTNSATRLTLSMRETPQSVTTLTRQRMDDEGMITLSDAVRGTPGLAINKSGPERDDFYARGFQISNITYDGIPTSLDAAYGGDTLLSDLSIYDRVEVVRGATGLTQGTGNPGATINLVRKRPTREKQLSLSASVGSWDRYGMQMDASGSLNESGSLRGRSVIAYQDNKSFQDLVTSQRQTVYGIMEADLGRHTLLTLGASYQKNDNNTSWRGLPVAPDGSDLKLPRSTYLGNEWNYWDKQTRSLFAELEHHFNNGWRAKLAVANVKAELEYFATTVSYDAATMQYNQNAGKYPYIDRKNSYDVYANGPFTLLGREHELVLGASKRDSKLDMAGSGVVLYTGMNLNDWDHNLVPRPSLNNISFSMHNHEKQEGLYATTRLNVTDNLKVILGGRLDWFHMRSTDSWSTSDYKVSQQLTKYAGAIYDLDAKHSVYASYTDIFNPQNNHDDSLKLLEPVVGKNYEIGIKGEYFGGALNASAALFRIDQENMAIEMEDQSTCPSYPDFYCYRSAGAIRSQGVDLEIQGALTPDWQLSAGYTFVDKKYEQDANPANIGQRASTGLPRQQFKLSTLYHLPREWMGGRMRIGGNVIWQSEVHYASTGFRSSQPAYAVVGLVAGYRLNRHVDIQLNINNLFDKYYYQEISNRARLGDNIYGAPRNAMLNLKYTF